jgi:hypothetical protein
MTEWKRKFEEGELPEDMQGLDPDSITGGFDMEVESAVLYRIKMADLMSNYWFVLIPLLVGGCLGCAWLVGRLRGVG